MDSTGHVPHRSNPLPRRGRAARRADRSRGAVLACVLLAALGAGEAAGQPEGEPEGLFLAAGAGGRGSTSRGGGTTVADSA